MIYILNFPTSQQIVSRALYLAWTQSSSSTDRFVQYPLDVPLDQIEAALWKYSAEYERPAVRPTYLLGRHVHLEIPFFGDTSIQLPDTRPSIQRQTWAHAYPTYESLIAAAICELQHP